MCLGWQPRGKPAADAISWAAPGKICYHDWERFNYNCGLNCWRQGWAVQGPRQEKGSWVLRHTLGLPSLWPIGHAWVSLTHTGTNSAHLALQSISIHNQSQIFWPLLKWSQSILLALSFLGAWPTKIYILVAKLTLSSLENCQTTLHASKWDLVKKTGPVLCYYYQSYKTSTVPSTQSVSRYHCAQHIVGVQ